MSIKSKPIGIKTLRKMREINLIKTYKQIAEDIGSSEMTVGNALRTGRATVSVITKFESYNPKEEIPA